MNFRYFTHITFEEVQFLRRIHKNVEDMKRAKMDYEDTRHWKSSKWSVNIATVNEKEREELRSFPSLKEMMPISTIILNKMESSGSDSLKSIFGIIPPTDMPEENEIKIYDMDDRIDLIKVGGIEIPYDIYSDFSEEEKDLLKVFTPDYDYRRIISCIGEKEIKEKIEILGCPMSLGHKTTWRYDIEAIKEIWIAVDKLGNPIENHGWIWIKALYTIAEEISIVTNGSTKRLQGLSKILGEEAITPIYLHIKWDENLMMAIQAALEYQENTRFWSGE